MATNREIHRTLEQIDEILQSLGELQDSPCFSKTSWGNDIRDMIFRLEVFQGALQEESEPLG